MKKYYLLILLVNCVFYVIAQETFPRNDVKDERLNAYVFKNVNIVVDAQQTITNGMMAISKGKIVDVGPTVTVPKNFIEIDLKGKYIYPSFIDLSTNYGLPEVQQTRFRYGQVEQIESKTEGAYNANQAIKSEYVASHEFKVNKSAAEKYWKIGFGAVLSFKPDGLARGTSAFVALDEDTENKVIINPEVAAHYSFSKGSSTQDYPVSAMGYIALLRQTYMDAAWYKSLSIKPFVDQSLMAWNSIQQLPQIFEANNWLQVLRADKIGDEFGKQYIIKTSCDTYQRLAEIKATGAPLIVSLDFPEALDVDDPIEAENTSLAEMLHWELAPTNLAKLEEAGINFAITSDQSEKNFWKNLRSAIKNGLSEATALKALTTIPASLVQMDNKIGRIQKGMLANFLITSGNVFDEETTIFENWILGKKHEVNPMNLPEISGKYNLTLNNDRHFDMEISGKPAKPSAKIVIDDSISLKVNIAATSDLVNLDIDFKDQLDVSGTVRLVGWISGNDLKGNGRLGNGEWIEWQANFDAPLTEKEKDDKSADDSVEVKGDVLFPFIGYGGKTLPVAKTVIFKGATVWTNEAEGILEASDVLIRNGKIVAIGENLSDPSAEVVDAQGKHLTSGIIDEHTHIATSSVNDVAANSGMVRIGDVIDSEDIDIYRQLAGGVTAAQILHGSANPVGGQSALVKFRWGSSPEEMKIKDADKFIKFALGENVKRSRSSSSIRYPQSRMGVEQIYMDAFTNALEYQKKWDEYNKLTSRQKQTATSPRRDLVHETMLEIINSERFITCHSYVQSEINMLMHVADKFGFNVNTFTHILEGYKVADKMAAHGAGGSTFADWWAYKWEVRYAIPYNPWLMQKAGVTVAINSDDAEMARRLNQEAAKSIKYGDMAEEDAWKMVTLNPAKLLHLDDRMGSIKVGKDADLVLWSHNPLSVYAKAEKTFVDGVQYFDLQEDLEKRAFVEKERSRLMNKMKLAKGNGESVKKPVRRSSIEMHCDVIVGEHFIYLGDQ